MKEMIAPPALVKDNYGVRSVIRDLLFMVLINTMIALFLTSLHFGGGFGSNVVFSQCIGLAVYACVKASYWFLRDKSLVINLSGITIAIAVGVLIGIACGGAITGHRIMFNPEGRELFLKAFYISLLLGAVISYLFISREKLADARANIQEEKIRRLAQEKLAVEMHLKLLQAQIEPHFLFNTLSNIHGLMEKDHARAEKMLLDFTSYLRKSLSQSRSEETTVSDEMDLITAYLDICKTRMGDRLKYSIHLAPGTGEILLPPMLVQPLVENGVRHGLEQAVAGGEITVEAMVHNNLLRITIADTGIGMSQTSQPGVGTENIRERLRSLYGDKGQLTFAENQPQGLKTMIELPYAID
ncbi:sensor histidine kinase [Thermodesulfobacteriota bacterium]